MSQKIACYTLLGKTMQCAMPSADSMPVWLVTADCHKVNHKSKASYAVFPNEAVSCLTAFWDEFTYSWQVTRQPIVFWDVGTSIPCNKTFIGVEALFCCGVLCLRKQDKCAKPASLPWHTHPKQGNIYLCWSTLLLRVLYLIYMTSAHHCHTHNL